MNLKIEAEFKDRIGVVADISAAIAGLSLNIVSMEVIRKDNRASVYVEIDVAPDDDNQHDIIDLIQKIPQLLHTDVIDTMPHEARENRFRVVLDNIHDGVLAVDSKSRITVVNRMLGKALGRDVRRFAGRRPETAGLPHVNILSCLDGNRFSDRKNRLISRGSRLEYVSTGRPIRDKSGRIIGAVEIFKDLQEIKRLADVITAPGPVSFSDIIGRHPAIMDAVSFAEKIASADSIVSVRGENGTGKELFARAIHAASARKGAFVPVNCAALPDNLFESELFGYVGGAFTGGKKEGKSGLFQAADGGTLFLDEIAEMPLRSQSKLLRVIQEKHIRRVGDDRELPVNVRIITATNRNLEKQVAEKLFRQDLYYRISVLPIQIPPLRQRGEDIPLLIDHFLFHLASRRGIKTQSMTPVAIDKMRRHHWPGNARELKNVVERASILCESRIIDKPYILFSHEINRGRQEAGMAHLASVNEKPLKFRMAAFEKMIVTEAVGKYPSIRSAARELGISHTALRNKLKKHKLAVQKTENKKIVST